MAEKTQDANRITYRLTASDKRAVENAAVEYFDSIEAFAAWCGEHVKQPRYRTAETDDWHGDNFDKTMVKLATGDEMVIEEAKSILAALDGSGITASGANGYGHDLAGHFVSMPAYYAGMPDCMLIKNVESINERAPVRVYFDTCVSGGWNQQEILARGIACLALVLALQARRPVELYVVGSMWGRLRTDGPASLVSPIIRVETRPLDVATLSYVMTGTSILRRLFFGYGEMKGQFQGSWAFATYPTNDDFFAKVRAALGLGPHDLYLFGGALEEKAQMRDNPVSWVADKLELHKELLASL